MNNKGQVLVLFVLILPVVLLFIYFVYYRLDLNIEKNNHKKIINDMCNMYKKNKDLDKLIEYASINDNKLEVSIEDINDTIKITLIKEKNNILNKKDKIKTILLCN